MYDLPHCHVEYPKQLTLAAPATEPDSRNEVSPPCIRHWRQCTGGGCTQLHLHCPSRVNTYRSKPLCLSPRSHPVCQDTSLVLRFGRRCCPLRAGPLAGWRSSRFGRTSSHPALAKGEGGGGVLRAGCSRQRGVAPHTKPWAPHTQPWAPHTQPWAPLTRPWAPHTQPWASMASATFRKPAMLAPPCRLTPYSSDADLQAV